MYHSDYPTKPVGGTNPYYCCSLCERTDPAINGRIEGHREDCLYRQVKEAIRDGGDLSHLIEELEAMDEDIDGRRYYDTRPLLVEIKRAESRSSDPASRTSTSR